MGAVAPAGKLAGCAEAIGVGRKEKPAKVNAERRTETARHPIECTPVNFGEPERLVKLLVRDGPPWTSEAG